MNKENQRINLTKRMLKEALFELLKIKNIQKISITELCEKAGINRATFYRHYTIPQDILFEIEDKMEKSARQLAPLPSNAKELEAYIFKLCKYIGDNTDIIKVLINHNSQFSINRIFDGVYETLKSTKRIVLNNTVIDDESVDLISIYCAGGGYHLLKKWLIDDIKKPPEEIAKLICNLFNTNVSWSF